MRIFLIFFSLIFQVSLISVFAETDPGGGQSRNWQTPFPIKTSGDSLVRDTLRLTDVLERIATDNPNLRALESRSKTSGHLIYQAGRRPNPALSLEAENLSGSYSGLTQTEATLGLTHRFELGGKRGARLRAAIADSSLVEIDNSVTRYQLYALAKDRFYTVLHAQEHLSLTTHARAVADEVVEAISLRVREGASPTSDLQLAQIERQRAILNVKRAEVELAARRQELAALWSADSNSYPVSGTLGVSTNAVTSITIDSLAQIAADVLRADVALAANTALIRLERSSGRPDLDITGGVKRLEGDKATTFVLGLTAPLPLFDRRQGAVAAFQSRADELASTRRVAEYEALSRLRVLQMQLVQTLASRDTVELEILPSSEKAFENLREAYRLGTIPYSNLLEGERAVIETHGLLNDLNFEIRRTLIAFERLVGIKSEELFSIQERQ